MRLPRSLSCLVLLALALGCSQASLTEPPAQTPPDPSAPAGDAGSPATGDAAPPDADPGTHASNLRIVAANISSGAASTYDPGEGIRMLQGLRPDIALLQELNYGANADADIRTFVTTAFGADFVFFRESGVQIPNAIVSRHPILTSGRWADPEVDNRGFVYAKIQVPGPRPLWAVSVHFLTTGGIDRNAEAASLATQLGSVVGKDDLVVIGGDFNTEERSEPCIGTLAQLVATTGPYPVDQSGNDSTNAPRNKPYDWVLTGPALQAAEVPVALGDSRFPAGLVFDSRVYTPLADVAPVAATDSAAVNMQHMPVVRDFYLAQ